MYLVVNGEKIGVDEYRELREIFKHDCQQFAGVYHGEPERSDKFRVNWPDEYAFVEANWVNFVAHCRAIYAEKLTDKTVPEIIKQKIFKILAIEAMTSAALDREKSTRTQLFPGTPEFHGTRADRLRINELFGNKPNFRAAVLNGAAKINLTRH